MEKDNAQLALNVFNTICASLDSREWNYKKDLDDLSITCGASGEDLPIPLEIKVIAERKLVLLLSVIPAIVAEENRVDVAVAISIINDRLVDGSFDYDIKTGRIGFRMTCSYIESILSERLFDYLVLCACKTIDDYNEKLLMLGSGIISMEQFTDLINK